MGWPVAGRIDDTPDHCNQATSAFTTQGIDPAFESSLSPHPSILDLSGGEHHPRVRIFHAFYLLTM